LKLTWRAGRKNPYPETDRIACNSQGARFLHCTCNGLFRPKCDERNYSLSFRAWLNLLAPMCIMLFFCLAFHFAQASIGS
jgi:hypothetical protein